MVSVEEAKASVPKFFIGIVLILIWLPMIIKSEFNNKSNRLELKNVQNELNNLTTKNKFKEYYLESEYNKGLEHFVETTTGVETTAAELETTAAESKETSPFIFQEKYNKKKEFKTTEFIYVEQIEIQERKEKKTIQNDDGTTKIVYNWNKVNELDDKR